MDNTANTCGNDCEWKEDETPTFQKLYHFVIENHINAFQIGKGPQIFKLLRRVFTKPCSRLRVD